MSKKTKEQEKPFDGYKWLSQFAAHDNARPILNMIYVDGGNKAGYSCERVAVAADGFRLGVIPVADDMPIGFLPIHKGKTTIDKVEGCQFPAWDMILLQTDPFTLLVNTAELLAGLKQGYQLSAKVCLLWENDMLYLFFGDGQLGEILVEMPAVLDYGRGHVSTLEIAVNARYLIEAIKGWNDETTILAITAPNKPLVIEPKREGFNHPMALIMPRWLGDYAKSDSAEVWARMDTLRLDMRPDFSQWNGQGVRVEDTHTRLWEARKNGDPSSWMIGISQEDHKRRIETMTTPAYLVEAHIKLQNELDKMGWDHKRRMNAGKQTVNDGVKLSDKDKKLTPTESGEQFIAAIKLAAQTAGL